MPARSDIAKAHADFVMGLAARKPCPIAIDPDPEDFTARAICCEALIEGMQLHLTARSRTRPQRARLRHPRRRAHILDRGPSRRPQERHHRHLGRGRRTHPR